MREVRPRVRIAQVIALIAVSCVSTGCGALPPAPTVTPSPTTTASPSTYIEIPSTSEGEVARSVASGEPLLVDSVSLTATAAGVDYDVEAACGAADGTAAVSYRISSGATIVGEGTIACDGTLYRNTGLTGTGGTVQVLLVDLPPGVTRAFARIVPADG